MMKPVCERLVSHSAGDMYGGLTYHSTADCPPEDGERVALGTDFLGPDLGAVQPARDDVEHGEEPKENEGERGGTGAEAL